MLNKYPNLKNFLLFVAKSSYVGIVVIIAIFLAVTLSIRGADSINRPRSFSVEAEASKYVTPDTANISLGTEVRDPSAKQVQIKGSKVINEAVEAIKELGIEEENIRTDNYNISPEYKYNDDTNESEIYSYRMDVMIDIKTTKIDKISDILDAATDANINRVNSISFSIEDIEEIQHELKLEAIENAKARAQEQAKAAGLKLGRVLNVNEYGGPMPVFSERKAPAPMMDSAEFEESGSGGISINPGQNEVSVSVSVVYKVK
ncbi:DUF541 domain-containing protein [Candidatus Dojkabacteria bacterium]|nr:DUF541 domain-containing protein [Candidatus Dojkabacteria bacterium]